MPPPTRLVVTTIDGHSLTHDGQNLRSMKSYQWHGLLATAHQELGVIVEWAAPDGQERRPTKEE